MHSLACCSVVHSLVHFLRPLKLSFVSSPLQLCTDTDVELLENASSINNLLYCGYEQVGTYISHRCHNRACPKIFKWFNFEKLYVDLICTSIFAT